MSKRAAALEVVAPADELLTRNGATVMPSKSVPKRRRKRQPSLDAEIRIAARQIQATQMAEAYKAAALGIVARKLDEIRAILQAAGITATASLVAPGIQPMAVQSAPVPTGPLCIHCGRQAVRRTKPNKFNPTGSWYCATHAVLGAQQEFEDKVDGALLGEQKGTTVKKPVLIQTNAPAIIRPQVEAPAPAAEVAAAPEPPADGLKAALSALGT